MLTAEIREFAASMEVSFGRPVAFAPPLLDESVEKLTAALGFPLETDRVRMRVTDPLYQYELRAEFYGGSGVFLRTADRIFLSLRNARSSNDAKLVVGLIGKVGDQFLAQTALPAQIRISTHLGLGSAGARDEYLQRFRIGPEIKHPGALGYVQVPGTERVVRVTIEPSFSHPDAIFLVAEADFPASEDWSSAVNSAMNVFKDALCVYGVEVASPD
jgi:hypothetical protein